MKQSNGGYVFLMESSTIEYIMERDCDLSKVGGELDSKSHRSGMLRFTQRISSNSETSTE